MNRCAALLSRIGPNFLIGPLQLLAAFTDHFKAGYSEIGVLASPDSFVFFFFSSLSLLPACWLCSPALPLPGPFGQASLAYPLEQSRGPSQAVRMLLRSARQNLADSTPTQVTRMPTRFSSMQRKSQKIPASSPLWLPTGKQECGHSALARRMCSTGPT